MKKRENKKNERTRVLNRSALATVGGGIGTWPTPERPLAFESLLSGYNPYAIDTVPLPE